MSHVRYPYSTFWIIYRPDEDANENSKSFENFEQVQIEIEPVDDKEDEEDEEALHLNNSYDMGKKDDSENLITNTDADNLTLDNKDEHSKDDSNSVKSMTTNQVENIPS